jgi:hypothetical protein
MEQRKVKTNTQPRSTKRLPAELETSYVEPSFAIRAAMTGQTAVVAVHNANVKILERWCKDEGLRRF